MVGLTCHLDGHLQGGRHEQHVDEVVFGKGDAPVSEAFGGLRLFDHVVVQPLAAVGGIRVVGGQEVVGVHGEKSDGAR